MKKLKKLPFFIALLSTISPVSLFSEESFIPKPPSLNASNYILMDSVSGRILAENGSDERIEPASITKIMTGYVAADQIAKGFVSLEDEVLISENCWKKGGSKMFIKEGTEVNQITNGKSSVDKYFSRSGDIGSEHSTALDKILETSEINPGVPNVVYTLD